MSLENVRSHWRFLLKAAVIFLLVAAAGPAMMYLVFLLMVALLDGFGGSGILLFAGVSAALMLAWWALVLWLGSRSEARSADLQQVGPKSPEIISG